MLFITLFSLLVKTYCLNILEIRKQFYQVIVFLGGLILLLMIYQTNIRRGRQREEYTYHPLPPIFENNKTGKMLLHKNHIKLVFMKSNAFLSEVLYRQTCIHLTTLGDYSKDVLKHIFYLSLANSIKIDQELPNLKNTNRQTF